MAGYLLWRPFLSQQFPDQLEVIISVVAIAPGATAAGAGSALGFAGPVRTVNVRATVAL